MCVSRLRLTAVKCCTPQPFAYLWLAALAIFILASTTVGLAQSPSNIVGIPPDASMYPIPGVGFVNLTSGNLHIEIPLRSAKDRNGSPITTSVSYDTSIWQIIQVTGTNGTPVSDWAANIGTNENASIFASTVGVTVSPNYTSLVTYTGPGTYNCGGDSKIPYYSGWEFIDGNGTIHPFPATADTEESEGTGCTDIPSVQGAATDGSGYWLEVTNYTSASVYDMHGNLVSSGGADTNGNESAAYVDRLGRVVALPSTFKYVYKDIYVWTNFGYGGVAELGPVKATVLSALTLPDGRQYTFQYDDAGNPAQQGHYGNLISMTLPTGGVVSLKSGGTSGIGMSAFPIEQITTPDGTWNFTYVSSPAKITATAPVDPITNVATVTTFTPGSTAVLTTTGASTLETVTTTYVEAGQVGTVTTNLNGKSSKVSYTYADVCTPRVATKKEYDYSGSLLRETDTSYLTSTADNTSLCGQDITTTPAWSTQYLQGSHHITDIPSSITVYGPSGSSGTPIAQTNYTYDSTALTTTSGSAGASVLNLKVGSLAIHDDADFGSTMKVRGNLTAVSRMVVPGTFETVSTNYYNILGELVKSVDGRGAISTMDYTDQWQDASCAPSPLFAYPTTATNALGQVSKAVNNSCDGSLSNFKNQNDINSSGPGTSYSYDSSQRATRVSLPDGGGSTTSYGGSAVPEVITSTTLATPDPSIVQESQLDGLGRSVLATMSSDSSPDYIATTYSLGRVQSVSNPYRSTSDSTYGLTSYAYDGLGRMTMQCDSDNTSMPTAVCKAGSAYQQWTYSGNITTRRDEVGNQWQQTTDGAGRLIMVLEPSATSATPSLETDYQYSGLDDITRIDQWGGANGNTGDRIRVFTYDGLSHLLKAQVPESGTTCYGTMSGTTCTGAFDANGNLQMKTDARGVKTMYAYDALNRLTSKHYSDNTPSAFYSYDTTADPGYTDFPVGQLVEKWTSLNPSSTNASTDPQAVTDAVYRHDQLGRVLAYGAVPQNYGFTTSNYYAGGSGFAYDLAGNSTQVNNWHTAAASPETIIDTTYDGVGRLKTVKVDAGSSGLNASLPTTLFQQASTSAIGITSAQLAFNPTSSAPAILLTQTFDKRMRQNSEAYATSTGSVSGSGISIYSYSIPGTNGYLANGNIANGTDSVLGTNTVTYDHLNRISSVMDTANACVGAKANWTYDTWGNRLSETFSGNSPCASSPSTTAQYSTLNQVTFTTNAPSGYAYDGNYYSSGNPPALDAGNVTNDGLNTYAYDAEGRMCASENGSTHAYTLYLYDADGRRLAKGSIEPPNGTPVTNAVCNPSLNSFSITESYDLLPDGRISQVFSNGLWQNNNVYANGNLLASYSGSSMYFQMMDQVGTRRAQISSDGNTANFVTWYSLPFGNSQVQSSGADTNQLHYTGKERDPETAPGTGNGNDYFEARYYASGEGRFLSPDPSSLYFADPNDPQSMNLYSYALNNPLVFLDPSGLAITCKTLPDTFNQTIGGGGQNSQGSIIVNGHYNDCSDDGLDEPNINVPSSAQSSPAPIQLPAIAPSKAGCPAVPTHPSGANVNQNMAKAKIQGIFNPLAPLWFYNQVNYGGPMDYKTQGAQYEDFGNFNYGATGTAAYAPAFTLLRAAGWAQRGHPSSPQFGGNPGSLPSMVLNPFGGTAPYGDDPHDQQMIQQGIQYARMGCGG